MGPPATAVIVFARTPVPGAVKRRLIPALGARGAAVLHRRMVARTVATATRAGVGPVELWCTPTTDHPFVRSLAARHRLSTHRQRGADLGARMRHAFETVRARHRRAILVGTDCPALETRDFRDAALRLAEGLDAVLGPADDGGYVLLGLGRVAPELFSDIDWGEATVHAVTMARLARLGWRSSELRTLRDVDRPEDLAYLPDGMRRGLWVTSQSVRASGRGSALPDTR